MRSSRLGLASLVLALAAACGSTGERRPDASAVSALAWEGSASPGPRAPSEAPKGLPRIPLPTGDGACTAPHDECTVGKNLSKDCSTCTKAVCEVDPGCCENPSIIGWDDMCVWTARGLAVCRSCRPSAHEIDASLPSPLLGAADVQDRARVVAGPAGQFFAVWEDRRSGSSSIVGARFTVPKKAGALDILDRGGLLIADGAKGPLFRPHVAFDGEAYVVAWTSGLVVKQVRVSPEASASAPVGETVDLATGNHVEVAALAAGALSGMPPQGATLAVVYEAIDGASLLPKGSFRGVVTTPSDGGLALVRQVDLGPLSGKGGIPAATFCEGAFRVAMPVETSQGAPTEWGISGFAIPVTLDSSPLLAEAWEPPSSWPLFPNEPLALALTCANDRPFLYAARAPGFVSCDQSYSALEGRDVSNAPTYPSFLVGKVPGSVSGLSVSASQAQHVVVWDEKKCGLGPGQLVGGPAMFVENSTVPLPGASPAVAVSTDAAIAVVTGNVSQVVSNERDILAKPLGASAWEVLSTAPNRQREPAIAPITVGGKPSYVAAWTDFETAPRVGTIQLAHLDANGHALVGQAIQHFGTSGRTPIVASSGAKWMAAWVSAAANGESPSGELSFAMGDGIEQATVLTTVPTPSSLAVRHPSAAAVGATFAVATEVGPTVCADSGCDFFLPTGLGLVRIDEDGSYDQVTFPETEARTPHVTAIDGNHAAVVFETNGVLRSLSFQGSMPLEAQAFVLGLLVSAPGRQSEPHLAMRDDSVGLLAWHDEGNGGHRIHAHLVNWDAEKRLLKLDEAASQVLVSGALAASRPRVVVDGDSAFLVLMEGSSQGAPRQIFGARVNFDGSLQEAAPVRYSSLEPDSLSPETASIEPGSWAAIEPAVASESGRVTIAYSQFLPKLGTERVVTLQPIARGKPGAGCLKPEHCGSGFCTDSACCVEACGELCQRCDDKGNCVPVKGEKDLGRSPETTCNDMKSCDKDGLCKLINGQECASDDDCVSGFCVASGPTQLPADGASANGFCCDSACSGPCETCGQPNSPGACTPLPCGPYGCVQGESTGKSCRTSCENTSDCAAGFQCVQGECVRPNGSSPQDAACALRTGTAAAPVTRWLLVALVGSLGLAARRARRRT